MFNHPRRCASSRPGRLLTALTLGAALLFGMNTTASAADQQSITLYAGQHQQMVRLLVNAFEKKSGITVNVRPGEGAALASQILREGKRSPADVFFTENTPELVRLDNEHRLAKVAPNTLAQVPSQYSASNGRWLGVLARQNVMVYNPQKIDKADLPQSLMDLASDAYKGKVAVSPAEGDFLPLVKAMAIKHGEAKTLQWLKGLKTNAKIYNEDEGVVNAVNNGSAALGDINDYYYYRVREQTGKDAMKAQIAHFASGDVGNLVNVSGVAILDSAPHPQAAQKFLKFMVSKQAQTMLANSQIDFEYPLRPGIAANEQVEPFDQLNPPKINVNDLGDNSLAIKLVREAGLL
ncbi:MAG: extracellular solute-binding protein [Salinisphaera sp.]|jgi:iron(III) transport system substrate-binding protein|nr:extracellular solute-binding protein [Salinisphaera sp.]